MTARTVDYSIKYPWQQSVVGTCSVGELRLAASCVGCFCATPESLPAKINAAQRAVAARLMDPKQPNAFERIALNEALRSLKELVGKRGQNLPHSTFFTLTLGGREAHSIGSP